MTGGAAISLTHMSKVPSVPAKEDQTRIQTVEPGVNDNAEISDIKLLELISSLQEIKVKELQDAPLYKAIPESVIPPDLSVTFNEPEAGTIVVNQTSALFKLGEDEPKIPAQAGSVGPTVSVAFKLVEFVYTQVEPTLKTGTPASQGLSFWAKREKFTVKKAKHIATVFLEKLNFII